jgi:hypothetical protein
MNGTKEMTARFAAVQGMSISWHGFARAAWPASFTTETQ